MKIYVCPKCHSFYAAATANEVKYCPECTALTQLTGIDYDAYMELSPEQKEQLKKEYIASHDFSKKSHSESENDDVKAGEKAWTKVLTDVKEDENTWANILTNVLTVILVLSVIGGVVIMFENVMIGLVTIVASIISCGSGLLMCSVAADIRCMRNQMTKYFDEMRKTK